MNDLVQQLTPLFWLVPCSGALQTILVLDNLNSFQRDKNSKDELSGNEKISVLIPARNEAENIESCLASLKKQTYQNFNVFVLDDCSEDNTLPLAKAFVEGDSRFNIIKGTDTPQGWTGKNHACHQLSRKADGDWLLFLDADTKLAPDALDYALSIAREDKADLLSLWPRQEMVSPAEKLIIPLLSFILLGFLPLRFAETSKSPIFTAANGQFMFFRKSSYESFGGHQAIKEEIMDDVRCAQRIKRAGGKVLIRDASTKVHCRMYRNFTSIWNGFKKNIYPAFNNRPFLFFLSLTALSLGHSLPIALAAIFFAVGSTGVALPFLTQFLISLLLRLILAIRLGQPRLSIILQPLAVSITVFIGLASFAAYNGAGVSWKGRTYKRG